MDRIKRIWYLLPMRAAKVQASLHIRTVSPEPPLLAHTSSESRGTFRQKARSLAPVNGWACAVKICPDGMLEDTNSLDGAHIKGMANSVDPDQTAPYRSSLIWVCTVYSCLFVPKFWNFYGTYFSSSSIMFSSVRPPYTLNFFRLHTCVFSYFPNVIVSTMDGFSSFSTRY